jgi:sortase A
MKVVIDKQSLRSLLRWAQRGFLFAAILALGYCAFVMGDAWLFQHREAARLDILRQEPAGRATPVAVSTQPIIGHDDLIGPDGLIGRIEIPRLGLSVVVVEGVEKPTLRRAVGHIPQTALPGQVGNIGIAAHRDTFFRPLRNIRHGDIVTLSTVRGEFHYRVVSTAIVFPEDVAVLNPDDGNQILTLITCYPFYFVGSAPKRFIVRAERVN